MFANTLRTRSDLKFLFFENINEIGRRQESQLGFRVASILYNGVGPRANVRIASYGFMVYSTARPKTGTFTSQCLLADWSAFAQGTMDRYPVLI